MAFWQWSKTSGNNGTIDPTINMAEGMPPAQLNDGGRAIMARLAEYRDDTAGFVNPNAAGTNSYTATSFQGLPATPTTGTQLAVVFANTNTVTNPTLSVDGGGAFPLISYSGNLTIGAIVTSVPYQMTFTGSTWVINNVLNPQATFAALNMTQAVNAMGMNQDIAVGIDGGGSVLTTGVKARIHVPFPITLQSWHVMCDVSNGSVVVDILRGSSSPPVSSIVGGGNKPTLSSQQNNDQSISGWTATTLALNDWIGFNITSASNLTNLNIALTGVRTGP